MWNKPSLDELEQLPPLYATEQVPIHDKIMHMHFFFGSCHWYAAEFDGEEIFFGYVILHGDMENAEWGYFSLTELSDICIYGYEVEFDMYWQPMPAAAIIYARQVL